MTDTRLVGPKQIETLVRVRYAETDAMGVVHHASYIVWLELGRTELLRMVGAPYPVIEERGFFVVLSDLHVRYLSAARYDNLIIVHAELTEVRSRQVVFRYQLRQAEGDRPVLEGKTEHIVVDRKTNRPARLPDDLYTILRGSQE